MTKDFQTVSVHGLGYIGLPTAVLIASRGLSVIGVDINPAVNQAIMAGSINIPEPDLEGLLQKVLSTGNLVAQEETAPADIFVIAVPTPVNKHFEPDLGPLMAATRNIAAVLRPGNLVIIESTCPIGTTEKVCELIKEQRPDLVLPDANERMANISVAYCPERVLPGRILNELVTNDRCIGGISDACARRAQRFYKTFVRGACITTTARTAEMVKLAENAYRDTNIAFANELSILSDRFGIDIWDVVDLANRHPRVNILKPGPGVGGHCIAVDPWFLVHSSPETTHLIRTSRQVNDAKLRYTLDKACQLLDEQPYSDAACLGLSFKANVDDIRESPALEIALELARRYGRRIRIVEPYLTHLPDVFAGTQARMISLDDALATCEIGILLVDHDQFKSVPIFDRRHMSILDTRGLWRDMVRASPLPAISRVQHNVTELIIETAEKEAIPELRTA